MVVGATSCSACGENCFWRQLVFGGFSTGCQAKQCVMKGGQRIKKVSVAFCNLQRDHRPLAPTRVLCYVLNDRLSNGSLALEMTMDESTRIAKSSLERWMSMGAVTFDILWGNRIFSPVLKMISNYISFSISRTRKILGVFRMKNLFTGVLYGSYYYYYYYYKPGRVKNTEKLKWKSLFFCYFVLQLFSSRIFVEYFL